MMSNDTERAAQARSAGMPAPASRPSQRRSAEAPESLASVAIPAKIELRAKAQPAPDPEDVGEVPDGMLDFVGYASVTDTSYDMWDMFGPYTEQVSQGAFDKTLAANPDVPLVLAHDSMRRIARTTNGSLRLTVDDHGLAVNADLDPADLDVAYIAPKLQAGLIDEMSFRFHIVRGSWSPDWTEYHIEEVDIHRGDVAIVGYGANPATAGSGLRDEPEQAPKVSRAVITDDDTRFRHPRR